MSEENNNPGLLPLAALLGSASLASALYLITHPRRTIVTPHDPWPGEELLLPSEKAPEDASGFFTDLPLDEEIFLLSVAAHKEDDTPDEQHDTCMLQMPSSAPEPASTTPPEALVKHVTESLPELETKPEPHSLTELAPHREEPVDTLPAVEIETTADEKAAPSPEAATPHAAILEAKPALPFGTLFTAMVMTAAMLLARTQYPAIGCDAQQLTQSAVALFTMNGAHELQSLSPLAEQKQTTASESAAPSAPLPSPTLKPATQTQQAIAESTPAPHPEALDSRVAVQLATPHLINAEAGLRNFYQALDDLANHRRSAPVRIVHYGDSPTTADLITGDNRTHLQSLYGNAGHGFIFIDRPWAWYNHRDVSLTAHGWKIAHAVGAMREGDYGLGGASFEGSPGAWSKLRPVDTSINSVEVYYQRRPGGGSFEVSCGERRLMLIATSSQIARADFTRIALPEGGCSIGIRPTEGTVTLFGITLDKLGPGVAYDSLGLNGASTIVLSRVFRRSHWIEQLRHRHPELVIINYGTNESGYLSWIDHQYESELRTAIGRIREALPESSILLVSPMDRGERQGGTIVTVEGIKHIVALQERIARDTGCAFFNTYQAMGGELTMRHWYEDEPRMVAADLIHPSPRGARLVSDAFVSELAEGLRRHQHQTAPNLAQSPQQNPPAHEGAN